MSLSTSSLFKTPLLYLELVLINCLSSTQTTSRAERKKKEKQPLAAQPNDDSFMAPYWNKSINYGTVHVKEDAQYHTIMLSNLTANH